MEIIEKFLKYYVHMLVMVRPVKLRFVRKLPSVCYIKPRGVPVSALEEVILKVEELEAIRLKDYEGLSQEQCAKKMKISRGTFQRIISSAKKKIADALVNGKAIRIEGGYYKMVGPMGKGFRRRAGGPPNVCVCPVCGNRQQKIPGVPCSQMKCKKCGSLMVRGD